MAFCNGCVIFEYRRGIGIDLFPMAVHFGILNDYVVFECIGAVRSDIFSMAIH